MADFTLNALTRAGILDDADAPLPDGFVVVSSDPLVCRVDAGAGRVPSLIGVSAGTATVTVTRLVDGIAVAHSVEVVGAAPFDWHLGPESAA